MVTVSLSDALTGTWADIQQRNVTVPSVTICVVVGRSSAQCGSVMWGQAPILLIDEEILSRDPLEVLGWFLHQAAHELADNSRLPSHADQSRSHDAFFRDAAQDLGLEAEEDPAEGGGWSVTSVPATLAPRYAFTIHRLASVLTAREAPAFKLAMASCHCVPARRILVADSLLDEGEIHCQVCRKPFRLGSGTSGIAKE
jgi:hypothetical protein